MLMPILFVLLIWPTLLTCSLYKRGYVRDFSTISSKQANTLIECGAICKSEQFCLGFSYIEKYCQIIRYAYVDITIASFYFTPQPTQFHEVVYIDISVEETTTTEGKKNFHKEMDFFPI